MSEGDAKNVLLVDDDRHLMVVLSDFLTFEGYNVMQAVSAEDALRQMETTPPDIVVLDISMPGMGGLGFLRRITEPDGTLRFPVIVLTARAAMESFFEGVAADGFLSKPCSGVDLAREIRAILTRRAVDALGHEVCGRILLIENLSNVAEQLTSAFSKAGYDVEVAERGLGIFKKAAQHRPDVILAKETLPDMTGSAIALMARGHRSTQSIPFILYDSTQLLAAHQARGDRHPAVNAVVLSDEPDALLEAVRGLLGQGEPASANG